MDEVVDRERAIDKKTAQDLRGAGKIARESVVDRRTSGIIGRRIWLRKYLFSENTTCQRERGDERIFG